MIKAKVSADYKDIERIFAGGSIQKEILKVWSTEANAYVFEAWKILEMEGPLPLTIKANGEPLIDYRIYGNTEQTGTPTPENPVMPIGCGEKTENLFDYQTMAVSATTCYLNATGQEVVLTGWRISGYIPCNGKEFTINKIGGNSPAICLYDANKQFLTGKSYQTGDTLRKLPVTISSVTDAKYIRFSYVTLNDDLSEIIITEGSTAPDQYIPHGYKLPILSNSTVTDIYLGEVQTTRRIKKLVLTGKENWVKSSGGYNAFYFYMNANHMYPYPKKDNSALICNIATYTQSLGDYAHYPWYCVSDNAFGISTDSTVVGDTTVNKFKSWLAAQYTAGTPVTVWYVLAEPETGIVNEPLMKIGNYADTIDSTQANVQIPTSKGATILDYDGEDHFITSDGYELVDKNQNGFLLSGSTLRPSKMYIKYKGR